ncbi:glycosyltransferase family 39 protein [Tautonia plasticadhaerens]|uniref:Glycosyltransferase RgtA/B/C/D-like domain-containing protein n=1 Tax=Tautonia plasticadhaerens TaxID=2527974 RepID=A0A518H027_9BACT|nr:glycosyltransferase family 39 protein [Tautonia plasticadhaerens]QDV34185.1 hypothetical protein ElP_20690 [Tautonia plasticadhaerens]
MVPTPGPEGSASAGRSGETEAEAPRTAGRSPGVGLLRAELRWPTIGPSTWAAVAIAVGVAFRVAEYVADRTMWMDEEALLANVSGRPIFEFGEPMTNSQMAPPGFLAIARAWVRVLGDSSYAIRLLPLCCGIAALFAIRGVAGRFTSALAVPIATAFCAASDDLIYYATEFKQYSSDLLIGLGCLWLGSGLMSGGWTRRRVVVSGALGVAAAWLSHPSVFVLGAVAGVVGLDAVVGRDWRRLAGAMGLGLTWAVAFWGCFVVSDAMISPGDREFLWTWWNFAFLPLPPGSIGEAVQVFWQFANVFSNPGGIGSPMGPRVTAILCVGLFLVGSASLAARDWRRALLLLLPIALTMAASALGRYPFHGRLLLVLIPSVLLPMSEGIAVSGRRCGRLVMVALVALLLVSPTTLALEHILVKGRLRVFDSHGDQRNDLLDALGGP